MESINDARIFVGTYGKYNEGSLFGKWLDLSDYSDKEEFYGACKELHKDEDDPEFMFQDWENIPYYLIGESWISPNFFGLREAMENLSDTEKEAFWAWLDNSQYGIEKQDCDDLVEKFNNDYRGEYDSEEAFAEEYVDECCDNIPDWIRPYFDYASFARDLFRGDYYMIDSYVFCN